MRIVAWADWCSPPGFRAARAAASPARRATSSSCSSPTCTGATTIQGEPRGEKLAAPRDCRSEPPRGKAPISWSSTGGSHANHDDPKVRRQRLAEFREQAAELKVPRCASSPASTMLRSTAARRTQEVIGGAAALHVRSQGRALHRARQHVRPRAGARRGADRVAQGRSRAAQGRRPDRRAHAPPAVFRCCRSGTGLRATAWQRSTLCCRIETSWCSTATSTTSTIIGRPHRAPRRAVADVPAVAGRHGRAEDPASLESSQPFDGLGFRGIHASATGAAPRVRGAAPGRGMIRVPGGRLPQRCFSARPAPTALRRPCPSASRWVRRSSNSAPQRSVFARVVRLRWY